MASHMPLILTDPSIKIATDDTVTTLKELACDASHVELMPDTAVTTVDTFCGSADFPGVTKWSLVMTLNQSFDVDATEDVLSAAVEFGAPVPFEIIGYKTPPVSATNPKWTGKVQPAPYSPINGDAGDVSTIEIEWAVVEGPIKSTTPGALMAASADLEGKTVAELQEIATGMGLATSGTKQELIDRITAAQS